MQFGTAQAIVIEMGEFINLKNCFSIISQAQLQRSKSKS